MKSRIFFILFFSIVIIGMGIYIYTLNKKVEEKTKKIFDLENISQNANSRYNKLIKTNDSLSFINALLSKYRTLTDAMKYRDSVRLPLKYTIGDKVFLKKDSSRAIVSDIIIGGSKHEYYIKYKVLFKNGQEDEILPELLY